MHNLFEHPSQGAPKDTGDYVIDPAGSWIVRNSGDSAAVSPGLHEFHTLVPAYSGIFAGYYHKFNRWGDYSPDYIFTKVQPISGNEVYDSFLDITRDAHIHSSIEDAAAEEDRLDVRFLDPWRTLHETGYVYTQPDSFQVLNLQQSEGELTNTNEFRGIFLNKEI